MQRPGLAARRFYRAFYQWNLLTSTTELPQTTTSCISSFHSTSHHNDEDQQSLPFRIRKQISPSSNAHISLKNLAPRHIKGKRRLQEPRQQSRERNALPKPMLEGPITSAAERPFHSMDAGEYVVRFRSEAGLMLEYAIPGDILAVAQKRYGTKPRLKGARIEVQELFKKRDGEGDLTEGNLVHSVLISGTFGEVGEAYEALVRCDGSDESSGVRDAGRMEDDTGDLNAARTEENPTLTARETGQPPADGISYRKAWTQRRVESAAKRPSATLQPLKDIVRSRSDKNIAVEIAFEADKMRKMQIRYGDQLQFMQWRYGCRISVNEHKKANGSPSYPTILLSGSWAAAHTTRMTILNEALQVEDPSVLSTSSKPSEELRAGQSVYRERPGSPPVMELVVWAQTWEQIEAEGEFADMAAALKVSIKAGDVRPKAGSECRSLYFDGPIGAMKSLRTMQEIYHLRLKKANSEVEESSNHEDSIAASKDSAELDRNTSGVARSSRQHAEEDRVSVSSTGGPENRHVPKAWIMNPVRSMANCPSSQVRLNKPVIRSRTESEITIEIALTAEEINVLQRRYGRQFEYLQWRYGMPFKLTVFDQSEADKESPPTAESSGAVGATVTIAGPWNDVAGACDQITAEKQTNWLSQLSFRCSTIPSSSLLLGSAVFRERSGQDLALEVMFFQDTWQRVESDFLRIAATLEVVIDPGEKVIHANDGAQAEGRSVVFSGPREGLITMRAMFRICTQKPRSLERRETEPATGNVDATAPPAASRKFTSLVEMFPPEAGNEKLLPYVLIRLDRVRAQTRCDIKDAERNAYFKLMRGEKNAVERAKAMIDKVIARGCEKLDLPMQSISVVHEQEDWKPTDEELNTLVERARPGQSTSLATQESTSIRAIQERAPTLAYRCILELDTPDKKDTIRSLLQQANLKQLRTVSGCEKVSFDQDSLIGYGSLDSVTKFREEVQTIARKVRGKEEGRPPKLESQIQFKLADTWAKVGVARAAGAGDLTPEELARLPGDVRIALRPLSHPVVVITSSILQKGANGNPTGEENISSEGRNLKSSTSTLKRCRAVTVSSFNTVTLEPQPIVSFNLKVPSRSWDAIAESGDLRIHLLAATTTGAAIADTFTRPYKNPYDGFLELKKLGVTVSTLGNGPPRVYHKDGVLVQIRAKLMPEKCVEIGDHFILVARVTSCQFVDEQGARPPSQMDSKFWEEIEGLAYANKGYRAVGKELSKTVQNEHSWLPSDLPDPLSLGDDVVEQSSQEQQHPGFKRVELVDRGPAPVGDPVYDVLSASKDAVTSGEEVDFDKVMNTYEDDLSPAVREEEDDYDFGFETPSFGVKREGRGKDDFAPSEERTRPNVNEDSPLWGPEDVAREESSRLRGNAEPGPNAKPSGSRTFSTLARPRRTAFRSTRQFSTTVRTLQDEPSPGKKDLNDLVEPSARKTNVADYLSIPENARLHTHHVRSLIRMNKENRHAQKLLTQDIGNLTPEERSDLHHKITTNDRIIAKKLAWNAAYHLRIMLDKGRVDFKQAQFLESAIEKGQAVLLEEATLVREMYQKGRISEGNFERVRRQLQGNADVYSTELTRLGSLADEEGDGAFVDQGEGKEGERFDGFRGNR